MLVRLGHITLKHFGMMKTSRNDKSSMHLGIESQCSNNKPNFEVTQKHGVPDQIRDIQ